jgi:soluble epoxide hydrolase / lipid-phosphate phosphatase
MTPADRAKFGFLRLGELQKRLISEEEPDAILFDDKVPLSHSRFVLSDLWSQEFEYYISNFKRGMIGPLSYYRTTKVRFEEERGQHTSFTSQST